MAISAWLTTPIYGAQTQLFVSTKEQGAVGGRLPSGHLVAQRGASIETPNNGTQ